MKKLLILTLILATSACATQRYGRATTVSETEKRELNCKGINIEVAKAEEFLIDIKTQRATVSGAHVLGFMGDFGLGNVMEGDAAQLSGEQRLKQLNDLKVARGC